MAVPLAGFTTLRLLRASAKTRVYEARRNRDQRRVVAKVFDDDDDAIEARVEHEFCLLCTLEIDGVVKPLGVERAGRELVLLLDYVPGRSLAELIVAGPMTVARFLPLALRMAEILGQIHAHRIIHRDIKPSNILIEAGSGRVVFADFGISVLLESERRHAHEPALLHGTLPYISPEQTGRTKREVDFRSDLYSLGVTFYELLTGAQPFAGDTPLEIVHAHLARLPPTPRALVPSLPERLSAIVMKLLAKAPEHRYQSAAGLRADLGQLAEALAAGVAEPQFELGRDDRSSQLQLPHQLYGRAREREVLRAELDAAIRGGTRRSVMIGGVHGIGRSALLASVEVDLGERGGYLALARCDADDDKPYAGLVRALQGLFEQILAERDEDLARWAEVLRAALGSVAAVLTALIPELGLVLGPVEAVPELPPTESRNRIHLAFDRLLGGCGRVAPLVLAIDDLQWADEASVALLADLARGSRGPTQLAVACRSDLTPGTAELAVRLGADGRSWRRIELEPLDGDSLIRLLGDGLGRSPADLAGLAAHVERKTGGRPLLIRQLLQRLADEGLLWVGAAGWCWALETLSAASIPFDVLAVLADKLARLEPDARALLELAACIGERFDPAVLLAFGGGPTLFAALDGLERAGLIDAVGRRFAFAHTQLRRAVYERIEPARRRRLHWGLGRYLLAQVGGRLTGADDDPALATVADILPTLRSRPSAELFALVDQLVEGFEAGAGDGDGDGDDKAALRRELGELAVLAGERALEAGAWKAARRYFTGALALLGSGALATPGAGALAVLGPGAVGDRLGFRARFGHAQTLHLVGDFAAADRAFTALGDEPLGVVERAEVIARRIHIASYAGRTQHAVALGVEAVQALGLDIDVDLDMPALRRRLLALAREATLERLLALAPVEAPRVLALMRLLSVLDMLSFTVDRRLFLHLVCCHIELGVGHGFHPSLIAVLHHMSFALLGAHAFIEARQLSEVGRALASRGAGVSEQLIAERSWMLYVGPCFQPFADFAGHVEVAHRRALEVGERGDACHKGAIGLILMLEAGVHLAEVRATLERFHAEHEDWAEANMRTVAGGARWVQEQLSGVRSESSLPEIAAWDDRDVAPLVHYGAVVNRMWALVLLEDYERAEREAERIADDYEEQMFGSWAGARFALLDAVVAGARGQAADCPEPVRADLRARVEQRLAVVQRWAGYGPANFQPYVDIVLGERAALDGALTEATHCYERARASAGEQGRAYVEALAGLRLAALAEGAGWTMVAEGALRGARRAFERWGAWAALERLDARLGIDERAPPQPATRSFVGAHTRDSSRSPTSAMPALDLEAILATVQSIGEDLRLEEVITRVLASAIESAGADRGLLLLERDGALALVAEGRDGRTTAFLDQALALGDARTLLPSAVVHYVLRTGPALVVDDALEDPRFAGDPYVQRSQVRSLLCLAIVKHSERLGVLVLENRLQPGVFTDDRLEVARILLAQAAGALDNARLYAELARSEAQWRSLVDGAPDVITLLDEQGRIEFINHLESLALDDVDPRSLLGTPGDALLEPDSAAQWRAALGEVVGTGERRELELCLDPGDGSRRWTMTRLAAIRVDGRLRRVLSITTDITGRKRLELDLRQQQRLESLGTLAAGVAHEINNPIQGILNYADLIVSRVDDRETVLEFAGEIMAESERVAGIVRNLLVFARQEGEQGLEQVAVAGLIESTLALIHAVIRKDDIALEIDLAEDLGQLRCRPQQIRQVIMNLITNARDALNERYLGYHADKRIRVVGERFHRDGPWLRITVEDHGGGVPEQVLAHIFDPFFTTKGRDQGTGLGLSVSHGIVEEHGGELRVESQRGVGSRFSIEVPAGED